MVELLLSGCAGYIGSITATMLQEQGYKVIGIDNFSTGKKENIPKGIEFLECDIADSSKIKRALNGRNIDCVFHFAAFIDVAESMRNPQKYIENNFNKSENFLNTILELGINKFIYSSSAAVYGNSSVEGLLKENSPLKPINAYGQSKLDFEKTLEQKSSKDFSFINLRYFNVAGSYKNIYEDHEPETHLIPLCLEVAFGLRDAIKIYGTDYSTNDGTAIRDYVHIRDLAEAHLLAYNALRERDSNKINRAYNVGYGKGFSVKEIVDTVKLVTKKTFTVIETARREGDPACLVADIDDISSNLNYKPKFNKLELIIKDAIVDKWTNKIT